MWSSAHGLLVAGRGDPVGELVGVRLAKEHRTRVAQPGDARCIDGRHSARRRPGSHPPLVPRRCRRDPSRRPGFRAGVRDPGRPKAPPRLRRAAASACSGAVRTNTYTADSTSVIRSSTASCQLYGRQLRPRISAPAPAASSREQLLAHQRASNTGGGSSSATSTAARLSSRGANAIKCPGDDPATLRDGGEGRRGLGDDGYLLRAHGKQAFHTQAGVRSARRCRRRATGVRRSRPWRPET